ncbi:MAG: glycosyltransferase family 4 protein [Clostridiales bacterium]|nr:glycosyltransferase family 4 protein [Clostridiales bacterium]
MNVVYIDTIIFDLQRSGGISVYWYEMIKRLLSDDEIEAHFIVSSAVKDNIFWDKLDLPQDRIIKYDKFLNRYRSVNYVEPRKHVFISSYYRCSKNKNATNITVVHDFTYEYFSKGLRKTVHHWQKMSAIKKSKKVVCISQNTRKDLNKFSKREINSIVAYNGISEAYRIMSDEEKNSALGAFDTQVREIINDGKYVLFVGQRGGYKNWRGAVETFKQLPIEYSMISVGGGEMSEIEKAFLGNDLERHYKLSNLLEEQLCLLYNNAYCLLYLSEYEGFGLPVAEAEQCGCPVMAMNRSSIPEIAQGSELVRLVDKIEPLPLDLKHGESRVKFSWDNTYTEIKKSCIEPYGEN